MEKREKVYWLRALVLGLDSWVQPLISWVTVGNLLNLYLVSDPYLKSKHHMESI